MSTPQTDIILPVRDALEYTRACVDTIFQHTQNFRLILVDDCSQPETTAYLLDLLSRNPLALYIRTGQQKWWTRAVNIGMRLLRTPWSVVVNSDCVVNSGWLQELMDVRDDAWGKVSFGKVGLVGSQFSEGEQRRWSETLYPNYVTGHCWLFDVNAMYQISEKRGDAGWYLDETKREAAHIESDKYACYELNHIGYGTVVSYKACVGHHGGRSWGHDLSKTARIRLGDRLKGEIYSI